MTGRRGLRSTRRSYVRKDMVFRSLCRNSSEPFSSSHWEVTDGAGCRTRTSSRNLGGTTTSTLGGNTSRGVTSSVMEVVVVVVVQVTTTVGDPVGSRGGREGGTGQSTRGWSSGTCPKSSSGRWTTASRSLTSTSGTTSDTAHSGSTNTYTGGVGDVCPQSLRVRPLSTVDTQTTSLTYGRETPRTLVGE